MAQQTNFYQGQMDAALHGLVEAAKKAERARIRRELLAALDKAEQVWEGCREAVEKRDIIDALDRICPEGD